MSDWQPIRTIPLDVDILVTDGNKIGLVTISFLPLSGLCFFPVGNCGCDVPMDVKAENATHWMPAPELPKEGSKS